MREEEEQIECDTLELRVIWFPCFRSFPFPMLMNPLFRDCFPLLHKSVLPFCPLFSFSGEISSLLLSLFLYFFLTQRLRSGKKKIIESCRQGHNEGELDQP